MTDIRETDIESYFARTAGIELNAEVYKISCPGRVGFPDRALYWMNRRGEKQHCLVELKKPGEKPRKRQELEHARLRSHGAAVFVCATKAQVDQLIEALALW